MTVCTFYAQLGNFCKITKITSSWGNSWRFPAGKKLPASVENHFHSETVGFLYIQYSLLQVQLNLQKKRDSFFFLLKQHRRADVTNQRRVWGNVFISVLDIVIKQGIESNLRLYVLETC